MRAVTNEIRKQSQQVREFKFIHVKGYRRKQYLTKLLPNVSKARKMIEIENTLFHYLSMLEVYGRNSTDNKFLKDLIKLVEDNR